MTEIHYLSAIALAGEIGAGRLSSLEVVSHLIYRIEARDGAVNAVVVRDFDQALASAAEADARVARGESLPLLGVPMLAKESFDLAGKPTTWGFTWGPRRDRRIRRRSHRAAQGGRRSCPWQVERNGGAVGLADVQSRLRHHQQSLGPGEIPRRLLGRFVRGACGGFCTDGAWLGHRRLPTRAGAFLRCVRTQAQLGLGAWNRA
jgi:hypothetical protein